jgi:hypothetical protein
MTKTRTITYKNITVDCDRCDASHLIKVPVVGWDHFTHSHMPIEEALPEISDVEKTLILDGLCVICSDAEYDEYPSDEEVEDDTELYL